MPPMDLRKALNAVSEVVANRPRPLREFDQIYMKSGDMLLHAELFSRWFAGKNLVFIGDGDAVGLCSIHLHKNELIDHAPATIKIMDFDERVVRSVESFAERFSLTDRVSASLYNVADALPDDELDKYDAFHINPPYGKSNDGYSIVAFLQRAYAACREKCEGCVVIADSLKYPWTHEVLMNVQSHLLENNFVVAELITEFHEYHLDDAPDLTSCSMFVRRRSHLSEHPENNPLPIDQLDDFYGRKNPLRIQYIRDLTNGGKLASNDHLATPIDRNARLF